MQNNDKESDFPNSIKKKQNKIIGDVTKNYDQPGSFMTLSRGLLGLRLAI